MKRREFLAASAAAGLGLGASAIWGKPDDKPGKELIELRTYHFQSEAKLKAFDGFLSRTALPALNRAGIQPVGVFRLLGKDNPEFQGDLEKPLLYILLPHKSPDSMILLIERLSGDPVLSGSSEPILDAPKSDPAYLRFESSLFLAFDGAPQVEVPTRAASRLLQLRIYESHNTERAMKKIAMFNEGGEIEIFRRCGMHPVFFGQALIGSKLPNLTYMLAFEDEGAQKRGWDAFRGHPDWLKLKGDPAYKDTVSNITNLILRPAASSQI